MLHSGMKHSELVNIQDVGKQELRLQMTFGFWFKIVQTRKIDSFNGKIDNSGLIGLINIRKIIGLVSYDIMNTSRKSEWSKLCVFLKKK